MPTLPTRTPAGVPFAPPDPRPDPAPVGAGREAATPAAAPPRACLNCGTPAPLAYCPACGQEQHSLHRSVRSLAAEALDSFAGWDGKVLSTFRVLLLHPGALTREFLDGRRARHLRPLRVYLTASALFFLALRTGNGRGTGTVNFNLSGDPDARVVAPVRVAPPSAPAGAAPGARSTAAPEAALEGFNARYKERKRAWAALSPAERNRRLSESFLGHLGATLFALLPLFALLTGVLWRRAGLFYAEHLVFALHAHAAAMLGLAVVELASPSAWAAVPALWVPVYAGLAVRRVFGRGQERRRWTVLKLGVLGTLYLVALGVGLLATLLVAVFDGV